MIIDATGRVLTPGNHGDDCLGNGGHFDGNGKKPECCCDECDYLLCCCNDEWLIMCRSCDDTNCPRKQN